MTGAAGDEGGMGGGTARKRRGRAVAAGAILVAAIGLGAARAADEAPYDDKLAELAETLGALHLLRPLCGAPEAQTWRDQMNAVLDAEQPSRERRQRLVDRFNQAYRGLASVHHACTPAARALAEIYRKRGEALGRELVSRWGHP